MQQIVHNWSKNKQTQSHQTDECVQLVVGQVVRHVLRCVVKVEYVRTALIVVGSEFRLCIALTEKYCFYIS